MSQSPNSPQQSHRVTMADIAAAGNCSLMTVSRALRNHPTVATKTRERIRQLAEQLGYRPDPELSRLMRHLHPGRILEPATIACLNLHPERNRWQNDSLGKMILSGAQKNAEVSGYRLSHFWLGDHKMSAPRFADVLRHRGIRGLFIPTVPHGTRMLETMPWDNLAVATCGYSLPHPRLHRASSHQYQAVRLAWQQLRQRGYRRIGLILNVGSLQSTKPLTIAGQADNNHNNNMWQSGFIACQRDEVFGSNLMPPVAKGKAAARGNATGNNKTAGKNEMIPPLVLPSSCTKTLLSWMRLHKPDAVIGNAGTIATMEKAGLSIPADCAFAALNITDAPPHASGVDHHMEGIGAAAIDLIIEQLSFHRYGLPSIAKTVMLECDWMDGSTAPPRESANSVRKKLR